MGGRVLVVGPVPVVELVLVVLVGQRGTVVLGATVVLAPGGRVVVVVGPEVAVDKVDKKVVVVGHGPTPPPGRGQSKWLVVVVFP
ncbi:MAG: hypothetical protein LC733_00545, partial [Actinobacteria bacterium]|nr:hypothetical protein [Actinomycetota bacterium]